MSQLMLDAVGDSQRCSAVANRMQLLEARVLAVQLCGSPGCGKTALVEATLKRLERCGRVGVVVAHPAAERDARQLRHLAADVVTCETHAVAPADLHAALDRLDLGALDILLIESPADEPIDVGEQARAALFSVTGGDDKAAEFPARVIGADVVLLGKMDLLPQVKFDPRLFRADVIRLNPRAELIEVSLRDGAGVERWIKWLMRKFESIQEKPPSNPSMPEWWFG